MIRMPGQSHQGPLPAADEPLRALAAELRRTVEHVAVQIGERNVTRCPRALVQTADYVEAEWRKLGYDPQRQAYDVAATTCWNVEAEIRGSAQPADIVIVGAHYDSCVGTPGANDNATGVAAVLALARRFVRHPARGTLRFVAFVNEEPPYFQTAHMGSWVYAQRCRQRGEPVRAMLSLETIGYYSDAPDSQKYPWPLALLYPSTGNFIGFVGNSHSADLVRRVVGDFRQAEPFPAEGAVLPELVPGVDFSDHWSFWQAGFPALMVTDTALFRYPHYHEPTDTPDKVDYERLARVVRGLEKVLAALVTADGRNQAEDAKPLVR
jgi:Zn-dependent M28 family amino/carboxypeptidase